MNIPLSKPFLGKEELNLIKEVLDSGWLAHGSKGRKFEQDFAKYVGTKHAIAFNSCTSALQVALQSEGIKKEVILPSFTFVASANSIVTAGATPKFVDIDYGT